MNGTSTAIRRSALTASAASHTTTPRPNRASQPPSVPGSPLQRYLRDPGGALQSVVGHLEAWATGPGLVIAPVLLVVVVSVLLARAWWLRRCQQRLGRDARLVAVLPPPAVDPAGAVALWANLVGLLRPAWRRRVSGQPHVGFEYRFTSEGSHIRLWVPGLVPPGMVERAVEAAWPGAHTTTTHLTDTSTRPEVSEAGLVVVGGVLRLARPEALPIRTRFDADPLRALFGAPVGLEPGEEAAVQVLARPVTGRRITRARRTATGLHDGRSARPAGRLLDLITPHTTPPRRGQSATAPGLDRVTALAYGAQDRAVAAKLAGPQFETVIRYAVTAPTPPEPVRGGLAATRDRLRGRAHAIASAFAGYSEHNHYARRRLTHPREVIGARGFPRRGDLLSVPELAALAHLPTDQPVVGLESAGARAVPPPPGIPTPTPGNAQGVKPLGAADTGHRRPVGLTVADARHHLHVLGATGSGKSTLMGQLILADATARRGVVVIDPKGDLVTDLLDRLPAETADRVFLFDADARTGTPCLNPLDPGPAGVSVETSVDNLTSIFARVYSRFWGPRTEDVLRAACLTLRAQPGTPTLAQLPGLLAEPATRARAVAHVNDEVLRGFWDWYEHLSPGAQAQAVAPLLNKLRAFLLRPFVKAAIAGGPSTLDMARVLDDGGICLVRIPKGSLGEDTTRLVGSLVVASVWQATTARAAVAQQQRRDCSLYVDECQNFLNLPYPLEDMLAEARGFRLSMTLAHQHLGQLGRELRDGISANARNKIFFTASPEDARELARHTTPRLGEHDLAHLAGYHAAARLLVHGAEAAPFTLTTTPLRSAVPGRARLLRRAAADNATRHTGSSAATRGPSATPTRAAAAGGDPRWHTSAAGKEERQ
ncbi:helicase HerA domain-containing protein [Jatrophihabitans lederbergiae]|uniref:Type IV secretion system DNA-binding domain-containing protein n=1 Tax=Jatrophihabitans lederbergiae TaxID=3075547 RepID=A0ABU2JI00_9ACTN|nr:DUF87 domain-containing protein [Jatrophihabitans sp. DSM 44399]MDT0264124.1 type IV secretion system DNA-binding domain-containing protein [Jatrophihabitans sp. DSM 44399]